jgi:hypothetical protein
MAKEVNNKPVEAKIVECDYVSHTPCHFTHGDKEFNLVKGVGYTLPDCAFVRSLIEQGRLVIKK